MRLTQLAKFAAAITLGAFPNVVFAQGGAAPSSPAPEAATVPAPTDEPVLELVCHGQGSHTQLGLSGIFASSGRRSAAAVGVTNANVQGPDTVRVRIQGKDSTIRLPRELYAGKFHNGTSDGWLKLIQVATNENQIKGKIDLFFTSHPQVQIDRDTGDIEINGNGDFTYAGNCEKAMTDAPRKF